MGIFGKIGHFFKHTTHKIGHGIMSGVHSIKHKIIKPVFHKTVSPIYHKVVKPVVHGVVKIVSNAGNTTNKIISGAGNAAEGIGKIFNSSLFPLVALGVGGYVLVKAR